MLGFCKKEPAQRQNTRDMAQHSKRGKAMIKRQKQQYDRQRKTQQEADKPQLLGVLPTHYMDELAHQVVGAGMWRLKRADLPDMSQARRSCQVGARVLEPGISADPTKDLQARCYG